MINNIDKLFFFKDELTKVQPTMEDLLKAGHDIQAAKEIFTMFNVEVNEFFQPEIEQELFHLFFNFFDTNGFAPSNWHFRKKPIDTGKHFVFANYDTDDILFDKESNEIRCVDFYNKENYKILAYNFDMFLSILLIEVEYDKVGYLNMRFTDNMRNEYTGKLLNILGDIDLISNYLS